jgi:hypothetical protein
MSKEIPYEQVNSLQVISMSVVIMVPTQWNLERYGSPWEGRLSEGRRAQTLSLPFHCKGTSEAPGAYQDWKLPWGYPL